MAIFFDALMTTELDARPAFCLRAIQSRTLQVVSPELNMRTKFFLKSMIRLRTMKKANRKGTKVGQKFHFFSRLIQHAIHSSLSDRARQPCRRRLSAKRRY